MEPIKTLTTKTKTLNIYPDDNAESPREWDNLSKMVCSHRRYNLGDKHDYDTNDYSGWEEVKQAIIRKENPAVILPLYMYDHSGITIRTTPFGDRWDSGQIGFVFVTKEAVRKEYGIKRVGKKHIEQAKQTLLNEVETYDQYITGDVYRFAVEDELGRVLDSCGGFYGSNYATNGMSEHIDDNELVELLKNS